MKTLEELLKEFPKREDHPRWTYEAASTLYRHIEPPLSRLGWRLAMTGSTLRLGEGADLDLWVAPWKEGCTKTQLCQFLEEELQVLLVDDAEGILAHTYGYIFQDGRLLEVTVYPGRAKRFAPEVDPQFWPDGPVAGMTVPEPTES